MQKRQNDQMLVELNTDEEATVQGGGLPFAIIAGGAAFADWVRKPGNGFFVNSDGRRGNVDDVYMGNSWMPEGDPNGWRWGIRDGGNWFLGGNGTKFNWIVDRLRSLAGR